MYSGLLTGIRCYTFHRLYSPFSHIVKCMISHYLPKPVFWIDLDRKNWREKLCFLPNKFFSLVWTEEFGDKKNKRRYFSAIDGVLHWYGQKFSEKRNEYPHFLCLKSPFTPGQADSRGLQYSYFISSFPDIQVI